MDELYDKIIAIRLSTSQLERLDDICRAQRRTRSQWIRLRLEHYLSDRETRIPPGPGGEGRPRA